MYWSISSDNLTQKKSKCYLIDEIFCGEWDWRMVQIDEHTGPIFLDWHFLMLQQKACLTLNQKEEEKDDKILLLLKEIWFVLQLDS